MVNKNSSSWYGWIPTNVGKLNFKFVGLHKDIQENDHDEIIVTDNTFRISNFSTKFISDTYAKAPKLFKKIFLPKIENEIFSKADIFLKERKQCFTGGISLKYKDTDYIISANVIIGKNGKTKIYNLVHSGTLDLELENFNNIDEFDDHIAQVFFVILKTIVHGDHHHHQKIDVAIKVSKNKFDYHKIMNDLMTQVKRIEYDIKSITRCGNELKIQNAIEEMNGYKSYIKTFGQIFIKPTEEEVYNSKISILDNIILSLKSSVNKHINKMTIKDKIYTSFVTYLALIVSLSILYMSTLSDYKLQVDYHAYFIALLFLFTYMGQHLSCRVKSIVFHKYYFLTEYIYHLEYSENEDLTKTDKFSKFFVIYGSIIYFFTLLLVSMYMLYLYNTSKPIIKDKETYPSTTNYNTFKNTSLILEKIDALKNNNYNEVKEVLNQNKFSLNDLIISFNKMQAQLKIDQNFSPIINQNIKYLPKGKIKIFYEKASILIKEEEKEKIYKLLSELKKDKQYIFLINGFSSTEKLISKNTFSNNLQLSFNRAKSIESFITSLLINKNFNYNNLKFFSFASSNEKFKYSSISKEKQRYSFIEAFEY